MNLRVALEARLHSSAFEVLQGSEVRSPDLLDVQRFRKAVELWCLKKAYPQTLQGPYIEVSRDPKNH